MTYGVDQCRVCGKPIKQHGPEDMNEWLEAQRRQRIPEKVWRARGYLAAPTKRQLIDVAHGCCQECGYREVRKKTKPFRRIAVALLVVLVLFTFVWIILTYVPNNELVH